MSEREYADVSAEESGDQQCAPVGSCRRRAQPKAPEKSNGGAISTNSCQHSDADYDQLEKELQAHFEASFKTILTWQVGPTRQILRKLFNGDRLPFIPTTDDTGSRYEFKATLKGINSSKSCKSVVSLNRAVFPFLRVFSHSSRGGIFQAQFYLFLWILHFLFFLSRWCHSSGQLSTLSKQ